MLTTNERNKDVEVQNHTCSLTHCSRRQIWLIHWCPLTALHKQYSWNSGVTVDRIYWIIMAGAVVLVLLTFMASDNGSSGLCDCGKAVSYCSCCFTACCTSNCTSYLHNWWSTWEGGGCSRRYFQVLFKFHFCCRHFLLHESQYRNDQWQFVSWPWTKTTFWTRFFWRWTSRRVDKSNV